MSRLPFAGLLFAAALSAQSPLVTTFAHDVAGFPNGAVYFDLDVDVNAITVTRMDLNLSGNGVVEVYTKPGTRIGSITNAAAWTLAGVGVVASAQPGVPTTIQLPPLVLAEGTHGFAIRGVGPLLMQTLGTGSNEVWQNAHATLRTGEATFALFAPPVLSPRVVNAAIHYLVGELAGVPPHTANQNGQSSGFHFAAQSNFNIRQLALPAQAFQLGDTASYLVRINGAVAYRSIGNVGAVDVNVHVQNGDLVDVIANWSAPAAGATSAHVSTAPPFPWLTSINGVQHTLERVGWSWDIGDPNWSHVGGTGFYLPPSTTSSFGRVLMTTEPGEVTASNVRLGDGCIRVSGSVWEQMSTAGFDLENSAITFTPQPGGGYQVAPGGTLLPVGATGTPTNLLLGDDQDVTVPFTVGSFPGWSGVRVCSNGFVSRSSGNGTSPTPSYAALLDAPRTAFWSWHDYNPTLGSGRIKVEQSPAVTVITWDGVWDAGGVSVTYANTLQFQLYANGTATIAWGTMSGLGGVHLVGYSPGGASPYVPETDLSAITGAGLSLAGTETFPLTLDALTRPIVGSSWDLAVSHVPAGTTLGLDVLGLSDPGFVELGIIGMPGCGLRASLDVLAPWFPNGTTHQRSFLVPNVVSLRGTLLYAMSAAFVPGVNAFGAITSNGMRARIGDL